MTMDQEIDLIETVKTIMQKQETIEKLLEQIRFFSQRPVSQLNQLNAIGKLTPRNQALI